MGSRPQGLAGLSASEVALKGTLNSRTGFVALVQGADNRTYIVRPGDKLLDGTIQTITEEAMVILQQVDDPLSLQKERAVRKSLR
jgi:Tfp pilus assembly protein PilP